MGFCILTTLSQLSRHNGSYACFICRKVLALIQNEKHSAKKRIVVSYPSHRIHSSDTQLMWQVVALHQTNTVLALRFHHVSKHEQSSMADSELTVTVPSISTALFTMRCTTSSAICLSASL